MNSLPAASEQFEKPISRKLTCTSFANINSLRFESLFKNLTDISKINYFSLPFLNKSAQALRKSNTLLTNESTTHKDQSYSAIYHQNLEQLLEQFPVNVTKLMNEDQLWGTFYLFPDMYSDAYSPTVKVRNLKEVPEMSNGILTNDVVSVCLSYLARTPILGDYVYIKLDISSMHLHHIDVLQQYKYLVYLDLSSNYLSELSVLSHLPYLQFLSVSFNRLSTVLEYDTPQWFLSEVHYKYNSVTRIRNLVEFWSITILDLSHNNIKNISGLETLQYLRRLDLSFNHIQRLESLNNLHLLWLDLSYNNISTFEFGHRCGLWTLLHLEYLNISENNFTSMKIFSGCSRMREIRARNNRFGTLLELAVYMRQMQRLNVLDLRANPVCSLPGYKEVVINTFYNLLNLDEDNLDPAEQRKLRMGMSPDINTFSIRRLLRLLYVEQLSRAKVSPHTPPADTTEVPIVVIVGYEGVGKGALVRRLASECSEHIEEAVMHTTAQYHKPEEYHYISRDKFDDMLLSGEFLTYSEINGESYGLSREEAFIKDGRVKITRMDLLGALMLNHRGRRPFLILASYTDKVQMAARQKERYNARVNNARLNADGPEEQSTLQVLLSGTIIITGIINEIIMNLPDVPYRSDFVLESESSILKDSELRQAANDYISGMKLFTKLESESYSGIEDVSKQTETSQIDTSLYSLYKESQDTDEFNSEVSGRSSSCPDKKSNRETEKQTKHGKPEKSKSVDFTRYTSSTWKGRQDSAKSSKSVNFNSQDDINFDQADSTVIQEKAKLMKSISAKLTTSVHNRMLRNSSGGSVDEDLWLSFLLDTGLLQTSEVAEKSSEISRQDTKIDEHNNIMDQIEYYQHFKPNEVASLESFLTSIRERYENIHLKCPGLFFDTVTMDDPEEAFIKMKKIIKGIVRSQNYVEPMFDIDFSNSFDYPNYQERLANIRNKIAPHRLFY